MVTQTATYEQALRKIIRHEYFIVSYSPLALQRWHNERDGVLNHRCLDCLPNRLFRRISKKTSKLRVTSLCEGNYPVAGEFPSQRTSNAENASIWWLHHDVLGKVVVTNCSAADGKQQKTLPRKCPIDIAVNTDDTAKYMNTGHDDVIKWNYLLRNWPFVRGIHRPPVNSPHKGQWRGDLMFSLICARINGWVNKRGAGDLRRHRTHYDVTVMVIYTNVESIWVHLQNDVKRGGVITRSISPKIPTAVTA